MSRYLHGDEALHCSNLSYLYIREQLSGTGLHTRQYIYLSVIHTYTRMHNCTSMHMRAFFRENDALFRRNMFAVSRLLEDGYIVRVAPARYALTGKALALLQRIEPTRLMIARTGHK